MPVWPGVMTLILGSLSIQHAANRSRLLAVVVGILFWGVYCAIWTAFTFRSVIF